MIFDAVTKYWHCNMPFSTQTRQWLKIYTSSNNTVCRDTDGIFEDKLQKGKTGHFTKKIWETQSKLTRAISVDLN